MHSNLSARSTVHPPLCLKPALSVIHGILSATLLLGAAACTPISPNPPGMDGSRTMGDAGDCSAVIGTCEPGGCQNENICIWR